MISFSLTATCGFGLKIRSAVEKFRLNACLPRDRFFRKPGVKSQREEEIFTFFVNGIVRHTVILVRTGFKEGRLVLLGQRHLKYLPVVLSVIVRQNRRLINGFGWLSDLSAERDLMGFDWLIYRLRSVYDGRW